MFDQLVGNMNSYGTRSDTDPKVFFMIELKASPMAGPNSFSRSFQFSFKKMFMLSPVIENFQ